MKQFVVVPEIRKISTTFPGMKSLFNSVGSTVKKEKKQQFFSFYSKANEIHFVKRKYNEQSIAKKETIELLFLYSKKQGS